MIPLGSRSLAQLAMLEYAVRKLGDLSNDLVFLGGCSTALFITDPVSPDVRQTMDVDCIVDVMSISDYYQLEQNLQTQGFRKAVGDNVVCRWYYDDLILDVMPTDEKILGFSNRWYKEAIHNSITHQLAKDVILRSVTAPYFLGTKLEAFNTRGQDDFMSSNDFEDIIAVIDGRLELANEVKHASLSLRKYLTDEFSAMLKRDDFQTALPGHLNYGSVTRERVGIVLDRIRRLCEG